MNLAPRMQPLPTPICIDSNDGLYALQNPWIVRLSNAVGQGDLKEVDALLNAHLIDPSLGDINGTTHDHHNSYGTVLRRSILQAQEHDRRSVVLERLLRHPGLKLDIADGFQRDPLYYAATLFDHQAPRLTALLLAAGAPLTIDRSAKSPWGDGFRWTTLQAVARQQTPYTAQVLDVLSDHGPLDLSVRDSQGSTLLHLALGTNTSLRAVMSDPAILNVARPAVIWLLAHGADLHAPRAHDGKTPMDLALALREQEPWTFAAIEQAFLRPVLLDQTLAAPSPPRFRPRL